MTNQHAHPASQSRASPSRRLPVTFSELNRFVQGLYPPHIGGYTPVISEEKQSQHLEGLCKSLSDERFFFVVNMPLFELTHCNGIKNWLGYSDKEFSLRQYWESVVHPGCKKSFLLIALRVFELLSSGQLPLNFMAQRFSCRMVLRHRNGHYLVAKKTSSVFQYDRQNRLMAYLDEYTIVGDFDGRTATEPRLYMSNGAASTALETYLHERARAQLLQLKVYSVNELKTARALAYDNSITRAALAARLGISVHTIDTYCRRFLHKTREYFNKADQEISSTLQAALFLKKEGLL